MTESAPAVSIRTATANDAAAIGELFADLATETILVGLSPEAQRHFLDANDAAAIVQFMSGAFRYHVAESAGELIGVVGVRDNSHLYHLFVARRLQGRGIGRRLWEHAVQDCLDRGNPGTFTVNSSLNAVGAYERLGFVATVPGQVRGGIPFVPMRLELPARDAADADQRNR